MDTTTRPIIHVRITNENGAELADVDAVSTCDGLAYYLASRGIAPAETEGSVRRNVWDSKMARYEGLDGDLLPDVLPVVTDTEPVVFEQRNPITGNLERQLLAEVH
jgi:hypothetical protein